MTFDDTVTEQSCAITFRKTYFYGPPGLLTRHFTLTDRIMFALNNYYGSTSYFGYPSKDGVNVKATYFSWGGDEPNSATERCCIVSTQRLD